MTFFEDIVIGETVSLGSHTFTPEAIIAFARDFDPQPFHLSEEGAAASHFGRLCASGWHTAAIWMRLMVDWRERQAREAETRGEPVGRLGPSPGFRNLVWSKPVYAGDTITYSATATEARPSASRPGWGLVFQRNEGVNQHGERVFAFDGCVFWERRGA